MYHEIRPSHFNAIWFCMQICAMVTCILYFVCKSVCEHLRVLFFFIQQWIHLNWHHFSISINSCILLCPIDCTVHDTRALALPNALPFYSFFSSFHCCLFCIHKTIEFISNSVCCCLFVFSSILSFPLAKVWFCEIHSNKQHIMNNTNGLKCVYFQVRLAKIFETMNCPKSAAKYFQTNKSACCLIRFLKL